MASSPQRDLDKLLGRAIALHQKGDLDRAETAYRAVLSSDPAHYNAFTLLGTLCLQRGETEEGIRLLGLSLDINPLQPNAYNSRGNAFKELKRYGEALADYEGACGLDPDFAEAWYNRGFVLKEVTRHDEALASYDKAIALRPGYARAYNNRGNVFKELEQHDKALLDYDRALALQPDNALIYNNRGNALGELKRYDEALASYDRAIALKPDYAEAYFGRGVVLRQLKRDNDALADFDRAIVLQPDYAEACCAKGSLKIMHGEWREGWELYEWRRKVRSTRFLFRDFQQPLWLGKENLTGKVILLWAEQGFGDAVQACRYVPMVEALGAKVIVQVAPSLAAVMATLSDTVSVIAKDDPLPAFDYHCLLMSLPLAFGTTVETIPAAPPYLTADPYKQKQWQERLGVKNLPRIGLVWSGSGKYGNKPNFRRDIPLSEFRKILRADHDYFCLQSEIRPADRYALMQGCGIKTYEDILSDFSDTAALIAEMDLVISVDTAVAHLAGALGKPVWVLLPDPPDFMWMTERDDSPWYPSARLFRQPRMDDWASVIDRVAKELETFKTPSPS